MRKLSEIKGEDAMDVLADLIEPIAEFSTDKEFIELIRKGDKIKAVSHAIKTHKKAVLTVMAILEGVNIEEYNPSLIRLPALLLEVFNDPELVELFPSAETVTSSGSATEITEEQKE
jgi:uncharacterized membrane protein YcjF (UPF0283 family)